MVDLVSADGGASHLAVDVSWPGTLGKGGRTGANIRVVVRKLTYRSQGDSRPGLRFKRLPLTVPLEDQVVSPGRIHCQVLFIAAKSVAGRAVRSVQVPAVLWLAVLDELHRMVLLIIGRIAIGFLGSARAALRVVPSFRDFREVGGAIDISSG